MVTMFPALYVYVAYSEGHGLFKFSKGILGCYVTVNLMEKLLIYLSETK
jgi:hypothetical protein